MDESVLEMAKKKKSGNSQKFSVNTLYSRAPRKGPLSACDGA